MSKDKTKNMTEGNSIALIVQFMMPLLAGNLFQQCYNLADSAIVGQTLGALSLGAVGVSSSVQFLVLDFASAPASDARFPWRSGSEPEITAECAGISGTVYC